MAVILPAMSLQNLTPSCTAFGSFESRFPGTVEGLQRLQGQPAAEVVNDQDTSAPIALPPVSFTPALTIAVYVVEAVSGLSGTSVAALAVAS
jgi:hypothetical protein